jgi:thiol-disulfide isomerase/thioredoxin
MKTWVSIFSIIASLCLFGHGEATAKENAQVDVGTFSRAALEPPEKADERAYLGIAPGKTFTLPQVSGDVLIVEIFSMYCPICQREAPKVNELHKMLEKDPALKGKYKLVGIGIGNTPFEVDVFRKKFHVTFPLLSDEDYSLEKAFTDRVRTPTFVVLKKDKGKGLQLIDVHIGHIDDIGKYLRNVVKAGNRK